MEVNTRESFEIGERIRATSRTVRNPGLGEDLLKYLLDSLNPVFIVGTSKSGTSFLISLFDSHPSVITLFETNVYAFTKRRFISHQEFREAVERFFAGHFRKVDQGFIHKSFIPDQFLRATERNVSLENPERMSRVLLHAILATVLDAVGAERARQVTHFVEKTPSHHRHASEIFADFPEARVIHMLRDPRDNYLALKRRGRDRTSSKYANPRYHPANFLRRELLASLDAAYENVARFDDRYRILFYEDLILGREGVLRELVAWLDLEWDDAWLVPSIGGEEWGGNSTAADLRGQLQPFDTRPMGRWRNELSGREIALGEYVIRHYGLQGKYSLTGTRIRTQFILGLMLPFAGELAREYSIAAKGNGLLRSLVVLGQGYVKRRAAILSHFQKRAGDPDGRLVEASFSPRAASSG